MIIPIKNILGVETLISSCYLGSWSAVVLMSVFNVFDLVGKMCSSLPLSWSPGTLVMMPVLRLTLIPAFMFVVTRYGLTIKRFEL